MKNFSYFITLSVVSSLLMGSSGYGSEIPVADELIYKHPQLNCSVTNHLKIIGADEAHKLKIFGEGVKIAVIDCNWFDCQSDIKDALTQTTIDRMAQIERPNKKDKGHANLVASIIAGKRGIAPKVQLEVFSQPEFSIHPKGDVDWKPKWESWCTTAINEAVATKVHFISMSIGWGLKGDNFPQSVADALYKARDAGIGVLLAAANHNKWGMMELGRDIYPNLKPILENMKGYLKMVVATSYSKNYKGVIEEYECSFSNWLSDDIQKYGITAPGQDILSCGTQSKEIVWEGTSTSTPMVASAAALIASQSPHLRGAAVLDILDQSARKTQLSPQTYEEFYKVCNMTNIRSNAYYKYGGNEEFDTYDEYLRDCYKDSIKLDKKKFGQGIINIPAALELAAQYSTAQK